MKSPTLVGPIEDYSIEREISKCKTFEDIQELGACLLNELAELQNRKQLGYDIYYQYQELEYKFE